MRILPVLLSSILVSAALAQDIRTVSNAAVDLTPIHKWKHKPEGERPMKHWKDITVLEVTGKSGVWPKCRISYEGEEKEVLLANADKIVAFIAEVKALPDQIANTEAWIDRAQRGLRQAEANAQAINHNPNIAATAYVPSTWYGSVEDARAALDKLRAHYADLQRLMPKFTNDLAMYTGKKYSSLEVWDMGKKK